MTETRVLHLTRAEVDLVDGGARSAIMFAGEIIEREIEQTVSLNAERALKEVLAQIREAIIRDGCVAMGGVSDLPRFVCKDEPGYSELVAAGATP